MLRCKDVAERASAFLDGELGAWDSLELKLHLAMCKGCGRLLDQLRITRDLTAAALRRSLPTEDDEARISAILAAARGGGTRGPTG
jgi:anti-sigma factor RsiW